MRRQSQKQSRQSFSLCFSMPNRQQNERRSHEHGQAPEIAQNDTDCIANAFESAKQDFMKNLKHPERYDFTNLSSAQAVYEVAKAIEKRQSKTKTLSALGRIEPYIKGLEGYVGVIDTFTQSNADLLCLIWVRLCEPLQSLKICLMAEH